jgi:hypothetical protein
MSISTSPLRQAAESAVAAPSIFNTRPWRWEIAEPGLLLWADRRRQLLVADPQARMLTVSCGAALHHARMTLAALGHETDIQCLPGPDLLAQINITGPHTPTQAEWTLRRAVESRRAGRRAFLPLPVPETLARELKDCARSQGARLHLLREEDLAGSPSPGIYPSRGSTYAVVATGQDDPVAWLRAGEALSAVVLTAASQGLGTAPVSDIAELAITREQLKDLLPGKSFPQLAVRIGRPLPIPLPAASYRAAGFDHP